MRPNATMPTTMSKFLAMGMPINEVIYRSTQRPAEVIKRSGLGQLSIGAEADVAVLKLHEGEYGFVDSGGAKLSGTRNLDCEMTLRAGQIIWDVNGRSRPEWEGLGEYKQVE